MGSLQEEVKRALQSAGAKAAVLIELYNAEILAKALTDSYPANTIETAVAAAANWLRGPETRAVERAFKGADYRGDFLTHLMTWYPGETLEHPGLPHIIVSSAKYQNLGLCMVFDRNVAPGLMSTKAKGEAARVLPLGPPPTDDLRLR